MKKFSFLLFFAGLAVVSLHAQLLFTWKEIQTCIGYDIYDICFPTETTGYLACNRGFVQKSVDGGATWKDISPKKDDGSREFDFWALHFFTDRKGVVAGEEHVYETSDGGNTWRGTKVSNHGHLYTFCFQDDNTGFTGGSKDTERPGIYRTTDGGKSWTECIIDSVGRSSVIRSIAFLDTDTGYAVGYYENDAYNEYALVLKTTDGGKTWKKQNWEMAAVLINVSFVDNKTGYMIGHRYKNYPGERIDRSIVMKTTDGGKSWDRQIFDQETFQDAHFPDKNNGYIVDYSYCYYTTDAGKTWTKTPALPLSLAKSVFFTKEGSGFIGDYRGSILKLVPDYSDIGDTENTDGAFAPYPNPAETSVTIPCPAEGGRLKVFNTLGVTQYEVTIESGADRVTLPVAGWPKGHYFFECNDTKGRFVVK